MNNLQNQDLIRELDKIHDVLDRVTEYLQAQNEANALLHMSDKVMYAPLTSAAGLASRNMYDLMKRLREEDGS